jgi:hypothetical protein
LQRRQLQWRRAVLFAPRRPRSAAARGRRRESPTASRILGAAKLTGRLPGGLTLGILDGVTQRAHGVADQTIEPFTNYAALRAQQDFRKGESGIGLMATAVNRDVDQWTEDFLRNHAYVGAVDLRHRFHGGRYRISGSFDVSTVGGTPAAMIATQRSFVHNYQRPDDELVVDSTATSLSGDAEELLFRRMSGFIQFETSYQRRSPGFELNDLGFLRRANQQSWNSWGSLNFQKPFAIFQQGFWNFNWWQFWTAAGGLPTERAANTNAHFQLKNGWWLHAGGTVGQLGGVFCTECARGGPAVRQERYIAPWAGFEGDQRMKIIPYLFINYYKGDDGRSSSLNLSPSVDLRVSSRFRGSVGLSVSHNIDDLRQLGPDTSGGTTHYAFARLDQHEASMSFRMDYTVTTNLTVQAYAQPFVSKGRNTNVRELANPRAPRYSDRYQPYPALAVGDFNSKFFNSNLVVRWEYRPGSTLFLVWSQGRDDFESTVGTRSFRGDFGRLFNAYPRNTFLIKASYWLTPLSP